MIIVEQSASLEDIPMAGGTSRVGSSTTLSHSTDSAIRNSSSNGADLGKTNGSVVTGGFPLRRDTRLIKSLDDLSTLEPLGQGASGVVQRVMHKPDSRIFALKVRYWM